jgi:hypothetical protein
MTRIGVLCLAFSALPCACADVPTITFQHSDAAAGGDAQSGDASQGSCTQPNDAAPNPYICCGSLACEGNCSGNCDTCVNKCGADPGVFCCAKTNNVVCLPLTSFCR